jgi:hypothetical protein
MPSSPQAIVLEDLSDADIVALRNEAIVHGEHRFADEMDEILRKRAAPDLYRHSRRRK